MVVFTLWPVARWREALPLIREAKPGAIMLHSDPDTLATRVPGIVNSMRAELGADMPREVWLGAAFDIQARALAVKVGGATRAQLPALIADVQKRRMRAASAAVAVGATNLMIDPEAAWKRAAKGFDAASAAEIVASLRAALPAGCRLTATSYDCPGYHSAFPWRGFDGVDAWAPQVYAAPAKGEPDPGGKSGRQRLALHQRFWRAAERDLWVKPRPCIGYIQAHHVTPRESVCIANAFDEVAMWAIPSRADANGRIAALALCALEREGFTGPGRVERFQTARGLTADGLAGPKTLEALGVPR